MTLKKYFDFVKTFFFPLLLIGAIFVGSSIFWTSDTPNSQEDMTRIRLGFPLDFVSQNHSRHDISFVPQYRNVGFGSPLEDGITIFWPLFFLSIAIVQLLLAAVLFFINSIFPNTQKFFRFLSVKYVLFCGVLFMLANFATTLLLGSWEKLKAGPGIHEPLPAPSNDIVPKAKLPNS